VVIDQISVIWIGLRLPEVRPVSSQRYGLMIRLGGGGVVSTEKNKARLEKRARVRKKETRVTYLFFLAAFFLAGM